MSDLEFLLRMRDGKRQLNSNLIRHFVDNNVLSVHKVRGVFMMAGILIPKIDSKEEVMDSIAKNMSLLNVFAHRTRFGSDSSSSSGETIQKIIAKKKNGAKKT